MVKWGDLYLNYNALYTKYDAPRYVSLDYLINYWDKMGPSIPHLLHLCMHYSSEITHRKQTTLFLKHTF